MDEEEGIDEIIDAETAPKPKPHPVHTPAGAQPGFVDRAWTVQDRVSKRWDGLGKGRIARVLRMARKPEPEEFRQSALIVLVGIAVIGALGFFVYLFMSWLLKAITPV
ncbi:MAG TPA: protein translocase SEC61 complex subunit gamma [Candidatus Thermoplasmatota archaeon]|nr:protein translocase SEC61 complex subunit gamma [Candidatus Thermoplasmatota archaeon]